MTEVPDKQTEGTGHPRPGSRSRPGPAGRGRAGGRRGASRSDAAAAAAAPSRLPRRCPANGGGPLTVLPGEKLSRVAPVGRRGRPGRDLDDRRRRSTELEPVDGVGRETATPRTRGRAAPARRRGGRGRGRGRGRGDEALERARPGRRPRVPTPARRVRRRGGRGDSRSRRGPARRPAGDAVRVGLGLAARRTADGVGPPAARRPGRRRRGLRRAGDSRVPDRRAAARPPAARAAGGRGGRVAAVRAAAEAPTARPSTASATAAAAAAAGSTAIRTSAVGPAGQPVGDRRRSPGRQLCPPGRELSRPTSARAVRSSRSPLGRSVERGPAGARGDAAGPARPVPEGPSPRAAGRRSGADPTAGRGGSARRTCPTRGRGRPPKRRTTTGGDRDAACRVTTHRTCADAARSDAEAGCAKEARRPASRPQRSPQRGDPAPKPRPRRRPPRPDATATTAPRPMSERRRRRAEEARDPARRPNRPERGPARAPCRTQDGARGPCPRSGGGCACAANDSRPDRAVRTIGGGPASPRPADQRTGRDRQDDPRARSGGRSPVRDPDPVARPCRACRGCRLVERGRHPDVHRLAPTGPGDQIRIGNRDRPEDGTVRRLTSDLVLMSVEGGRRLAIIERADRLTDDAQTALLKTLEEPPGASRSSSAPTTRIASCRPSARGRRGSGSGRSRPERSRRSSPIPASPSRRSPHVWRGSAAGRPGAAPTLARAPDAVAARDEIARSLLDLLGAGPAIRLAAGARAARSRRQ